MDVTGTILRLAHVDALSCIAVIGEQLDQTCDRFCIFKFLHFLEIASEACLEIRHKNILTKLPMIYRIPPNIFFQILMNPNSNPSTSIIPQHLLRHIKKTINLSKFLHSLQDFLQELDAFVERQHDHISNAKAPWLL